MLELLHADESLMALVDPTEEFETLATGFVFTEGPTWHPRTGTLGFSDIRGDARWSWTASGGVTLEARPAWKVNGATVDLDGSTLLCEHVSSSVVRQRDDGAREVVAFHFDGTYLNSPNDVVVKSDGSIWFTDPDYGRWAHVVGVERPFELGFQGVYRVPPGGGPAELVVPRDEFRQPNGLCFSPDESVLYVDDVDNLKSFPVHADGSLGPARLVRSGMGSAGAETGNPDGMRCDEHGNVWVTARDGVWVFDPTGDLLGIIRTPEVCANLTWGGDDWRTLYLCTSTTVRRLRTLVASDPRTRHGI